MRLILIINEIKDSYYHSNLASNLITFCRSGKLTDNRYISYVQIIFISSSPSVTRYSLKYETEFARTMKLKASMASRSSVRWVIIKKIITRLWPTIGVKAVDVILLSHCPPMSFWTSMVIFYFMKVFFVLKWGSR